MELVVEKLSTTDLMVEAERLGVVISSHTGQLLAVLGELDRRQGWRTEGATSCAAWTAQRLGISESTGRTLSTMAERSWDLPELTQGLQSGDISFDKFRAVAPIATPETDASMLEQARTCSVRQLTDVARAHRGKSNEEAALDYESRYLRLNDERRTVNVQLPPDHYAMVRNTLVDIVKNESEAATDIPFDQRLCDAFLSLFQRGKGGGTSGRHPFVVAHTDLSVLLGGDGSAELQGLGTISEETVRRLACDGVVAVALDDSDGHTMYEGRAERLATDTQRREAARRDRHCRFPGCSNATFTNVHHIVPWLPDGPTDLPNLVTLCIHHHHRVHEGGWRMSGDANAELQFLGPSGQTMVSRPSPLWTRSTQGP
jgi:uncharacterized protein DUF222/HNH endonuclease